MIRSDNKQDGTGSGGAYAFKDALLALWLVVLGDDAYMAKWYILLWLWVVHDKISYVSWGYIVDVQIRFVIDSLIMHIWCLHDDLHKDKDKYKAWIHIFFTWWWVTHMLLSSYAQRSYNIVMMQELTWIDVVLIHSTGYMDDYSKLHCWRHDDDEFLPIWW